MKILLFTVFSLPVLFASAQIEPTLDPESNVVNLIAENRYETAVEYLQQLMQDDRNGTLPWFLLAGVYLRSGEYCGDDVFTNFLLAALAYKIYWQANERFHKHDPALLREICDQLPSIQYLQDQDIEEGHVFPVDCFNEKTAIISKESCLKHFEDE